LPGDFCLQNHSFEYRNINRKIRVLPSK